MRNIVINLAQRGATRVKSICGSDGGALNGLVVAICRARVGSEDEEEHRWRGEKDTEKG